MIRDKLLVMVDGTVANTSATSGAVVIPNVLKFNTIKNFKGDTVTSETIKAGDYDWLRVYIPTDGTGTGKFLCEFVTADSEDLTTTNATSLTLKAEAAGTAYDAGTVLYDGKLPNSFIMRKYCGIKLTKDANTNTVTVYIDAILGQLYTNS